MVRDQGDATSSGEDLPRRGFFLQGLLVSLSNPKPLLGALLPQFVDPAGSQLGQVVVFGGTALVFCILSDGTYALVAGRVGRRLNLAARRTIGRIGGGALIMGGAWLASERLR
jgi:homoserine/homoserine lactone efflux protein